MLAEFFGREAPSVAARRRLTKLVALVKHVAAKIDEHKGSLRDHKPWLEEFRGHHETPRAHCDAPMDHGVIAR